MTLLRCGETVSRMATLSRRVTLVAIRTASASDVDPSYMPAFATSIPVNWQTMDWNS